VGAFLPLYFWNILMLSLKEILTSYTDSLKPPSVSNGGWALDVYSPISFLLTPGCNIKLPAGFGGLISPQNSSLSHFSVSPGQLIHPEFEGQLTINLIYHGRTQETIKKGDPLCQIVFFNTPRIDD